MPSRKRSPKVAPADEQPKPTPAPFHEVYGLLLVGLPDSVLLKIKARAEVRGLDLAADDDAVRDLIETAREAYERKKAGSRASAARRRSAAKAKAAPEVEPLEAAPADAPAPAAEPTPLPSAS